MIVTHPFHPLNGQRLEVLYSKRRGADTVFVCAGGVSGQITLPQAWTDRGEPPLARRLSAEGPWDIWYRRDLRRDAEGDRPGTARLPRMQAVERRLDGDPEHASQNAYAPI